MLHALSRRIAAPSIKTDSLLPGVERAALGFGLVNPLLALPQLHNIFVLERVAGLSLITLGAALFMSLLWTAYGVLGRQKAVWATNAVWVVLNGAMVAGVIAHSL